MPLALGNLTCKAGSGGVLSAAGLVVTAQREGTAAVHITEKDGQDELDRHKITIAVVE
jgi:hypothetical protein